MTSYDDYTSSIYRMVWSETIGVSRSSRRDDKRGCDGARPVHHIGILACPLAGDIQDEGCARPGAPHCNIPSRTVAGLGMSVMPQRRTERLPSRGVQ